MKKNKEAQKKFIENLQLTKPRLWLKFINKNRLMYNSLCRPCQLKVYKAGGNIKPQDLCEVCKVSTSRYLAEIKKIIEEAGGVVKDD